MTTDAGLYGQSLYDLAAQEHLTEELLKELSQVESILKENPEYITLLSEPSIPKKERIGLVDKAFGDAVHPYLLNFMKILLENGLLRGFSSCCSIFRSNYNKDNGIAQAVVTGAVELTAEEAEKLKEKLEQISGRKIDLIRKVDPAVLGGIRVELEGKLYDGTVSGRLGDLRRKVSEIVV